MLPEKDEVIVSYNLYEEICSIFNVNTVILLNQNPINLRIIERI